MKITKEHTRYWRKVANGIYYSGGNIGLGTMTPTNMLELEEGTIQINSSADNNVLLRFNTDRSWNFKQQGTGASTQLELNAESTSKEFQIGVEDSPVMKICAQATATTSDAITIIPRSTTGGGGGITIDQNNDNKAVIIDSEATTASKTALQISTQGAYAITTSGGNVGIGTATPSTPLEVTGRVTINCDDLVVNNPTGNDDTKWVWRDNGSTSVEFIAGHTYDQLLICMNEKVGTQMILTEYGNRTKDHDHADQTNPTLYIHSATDPDSANTQWISLTHNQTDGLIDTGIGAVRFNKAIANNSTTISASADNTDVSGINTLFINTNGGDVVIGGFTGGVAGQVLYIAVIDASNNATLEYTEGVSDQDIYLTSGGDETLTASYGGWVLVCDGSNWYDCSN